MYPWKPHSRTFSIWLILLPNWKYWIFIVEFRVPMSPSSGTNQILNIYLWFRALTNTLYFEIMNSWLGCIVQKFVEGLSRYPIYATFHMLSKDFKVHQHIPTQSCDSLFVTRRFQHDPHGGAAFDQLTVRYREHIVVQLSRIKYCRALLHVKRA